MYYVYIFVCIYNALQPVREQRKENKSKNINI